MPNLLTCICGIDCFSNGPRRVCRSLSDCRYAETMSGWSLVPCTLDVALRNFCRRSKPMRNPSFRPQISQSVSCGSGCWCSKTSHWSVCRGVLTGCNAGWICGLGETKPSWCSESSCSTKGFGVPAGKHAAGVIHRTQL